LVGSVVVIELLVFAQRVEQVPVVPNQGAIKQFVAAGLYPLPLEKSSRLVRTLE
jgi:hypothetical protein